MILAVLAPVALLGSALLLPDGRTAEVDVACDPASVVVLDDTAYAACAAAGVLAIDVKGEEPRVLGLVALPGSVSGLHTSGGKVWAEVTRLEAYPLERPAVSLAVSGPRESAAGVPPIPRSWTKARRRPAAACSRRATAASAHLRSR
ncbi:MAG: hypothetical protein ACAI38_09620 [Myxococcota bacterium]